MDRRRDIDGLRAVAVLAVVAFHAHVPGFSGGFVGVDVFFVLSGFLITGIADREVAHGTFRIREFYRRRLRRIVPAFAVMAVTVGLVGSVVLLPRALMDLGRSLVAAATMTANVYFLGGDGYFDATSETLPLLHTWSLGVEEQFYLVFPLVAVVLAARVPRRHWPLVVAMGACASFACNVWLTGAWPSAAFFLPVGRAWQFLVGALVALVAWRPGGRWVREALAAIGLCALVLAVVGSQQLGYPGKAALVPTLATAAVILAGSASENGRTAVSRLLGWAPLVGVGLVSYSLYLWHWPALVLAREATLAQRLGPVATALVLAVSGALAVASWRWVEQPFRRWQAPPARVVLSGATATLVLVVAGVGLWRSDGLPGRVPATARQMERAAGDTAYEYRACSDPTLGATAGICRHGAPGDPVHVAVWGDSHAGTLLPAAADVAASRGQAVLGMTRPVCPPTRDLGTRFLGFDAFGCHAFNQVAMAQLELLPHLTDVVLVARWDKYEDWDPDPLERPVAFELVDGANRLVPFEDRLDRLGVALQEVVDHLEDRGVRVHVVYPIPAFEFNVARAAAVASTRGKLEDLARPRADVDAVTRRAVAMLDALDLGPASTRLRPVEAFCDDGWCLPVLDGAALFSDDDHLTRAGAQVLEPLLESVITASPRGGEPAGADPIQDPIQVDVTPPSPTDEDGPAPSPRSTAPDVVPGGPPDVTGEVIVPTPLDLPTEHDVLGCEQVDLAALEECLPPIPVPGVTVPDLVVPR